MKRIWLAVATFSLAEWVGRHPATAGTLMLLGIGGGIVAGNLVTPTITPQAAAYFNQSNAYGVTNNAVLPNGGTAGSMFVPTDVTASFAIPFEAMVDPNLVYSSSASQNLANGLALSANQGPGQPFFFIQKLYQGRSSLNWWNAAGAIGAFTSLGVASQGTTYNTGYYAATATGGGCQVEPSVVFQGSTGIAQVVNPGFNCSGWPSPASVNIAAVPGSGAQQPVGLAAGLAATTCALVNGQAVVTANVSVAHGLTAGMTYALQGFGAGFTGYNSATYTALQGTTAGVLVGTTGAGSCPASPATSGNEGTAFGGTGASITFPAGSATNPFGTGGTGITTKNGQHICGMLVENGDDSAFPGSAALSMTDDKGNALPGSPALVPNLNQATAFFNGYTVAGTQSPSSPALTVTSMVPLTISSAVFNSGANPNSTITFTMASALPATFQIGSEFTVSGLAPSSVNVTYVAIAGTTGSTVVANPLSGRGGALLPISPPGAITVVSSPQLVSVILPGMVLFGEFDPLGAVISPYGTFGSTGTGGVGTYALSTNQAAVAFSNASIAVGGVMTVNTVPFDNGLAVNQVFSGTGTGGNVTITGYLTGIGQTGTYQTNYAGGTAVANTSMTTTGALGSSGAPVPLFAYSAFYYSGNGISGTANAKAVKNTQANIGDFFNSLGSASTAIISPNSRGWGGALGNVAMLYGPAPLQTGGAPSTTAVASLCKKTTTIPAFAAANGMTVHSFYELNDIGVFGDSGIADVHGHTAGSTLTVDSTESGSLPTVTSSSPKVIVSGPGLPVAGVQITSGSAGVYTLASSVGTIASEAMKGGGFAPATPVASITAQGYIDGSPAQTLHVTSLDSTGHSGFASFTGSLSSEWTGSMTTGGLLTISSVQTNSSMVAGVGTIVNSAPGAATTFGPCPITSLGTGLGAAGTYQTNCTPGTAIASELMDGTGPLPSGPTTLNVSSVTGAIQVGQYVTDGSASLTGPPLLVTQSIGTNKWSVLGNYYPAISADATMTASLSTIVPGEYIRNASLTTPVKILPGWSACGITGAINGGLGCYTLSTAANGAVASAGSPTTFTGTTIGDGPAIAPGPALTISDPGGPALTFPVTNYGAGTGSLRLTGTYDVPTLGGTPSAIQVLISAIGANGSPIAGCTPCNWGTLTGTISGGAWSGSISGIPAGGPYSVSVRAANGTAYATLSSTVRVGLLFDMWGQGQTIAVTGGIGGYWYPYYSGLWGIANWSGIFSGGGYTMGPPVAANFVPGQIKATAGDRYGINGSTTPPLPEGTAYFEQTLSNAFGGWPVDFLNISHDGVGIELFTNGGVTQVQSIDVGDGTKASWCSVAKFCPGSSGGTVGQGGPMTYNAASQTGAWFLGSVATASSVSTLTIGTYQGGAFEPGMILSGAGVTGTPKLLYCKTGCTGVAGLASATWVLDTNLGTIASEAMRVDPVGGAPWPNFNYQFNGTPPAIGTGFGAFLIKAGTFQVMDNGTVVCQDSQTFAYDITGGNCTGAGIASSFINYQTGDYQITFSTAPASGRVISASWTNVTSPEAVNNQYSRPTNIDFLGDGTSQGGSVSSMEAKAPAGVSGHIYAGCSTDNTFITMAGSTANIGIQYGEVGYSQMVSGLYGSQFPNTIPGSSAATPFIAALHWRAEGPFAFTYPAAQQEGACVQWAEDISTKSMFSGTISGGVLTLSANAVGPMWEGEIIGGSTLGSFTGIYITSLNSGAWGASGSKYNLAGASGVSITDSFFNDVYYKGSGPAFYAGTLNDIAVQAGGLAGTTGYSAHAVNGPTGGPRSGRRWGAMISQGLNNSATPNDPTPDRVKANATGCDAAAIAAPCFDIGTTYQASHAATWSPTGNVVTVSGGLAAHARPFVAGQAFNCSGCDTGLVITSLSLPPTQDVTRTNAGEVGNTFTFTVANASTQAIGGSGTGTVTGGCSGTSGSGSNCIDIAIAINTTGTFGSAAAIATCGENSLNGNAPNYDVPNGACQDNGIGTLVRTFRIGTDQAMSNSTAGSVFDDGVDLVGGNFNQNAAFTCNIVAAKVVQCVKAPVLASGAFSSVGLWASGSTFVNYGDLSVVSGRLASVLGTVGAQSFPFTSGGTGYTSGVNRVHAVCGTIASGGWAPWFDVTVVGGIVIDVYPSSIANSGQQASGLGVGSTCTVTPPGAGSGFNTSGSITIPLAPLQGLGGIGTYNTDINTTGLFLYDNGGFPGNPLNGFYSNGMGGYFEPGDPVRPFGTFQGLAVSG
jgi:hypothetical protein